MNLVNRFINFLERKIGKYSISNLPLYMIIMYVLGYFMIMINPSIIDYISFDPYSVIFKFQFWRLFSWLLIPPDGGKITFWIIITLFFYYSISKDLERKWGTFYFNYYIFSGLIFTLFMGFTMFGILSLFNPYGMPIEIYGWIIGRMTSTYYICMSLLLAFSATYPDARVLMYFVIPLRVKILGYIYAGFLLLEVVMTWAEYKDIVYTSIHFFMLLASMLNFLILFLAMKKQNRSTRQFAKKFKKEVKMAPQQGISKHKCAICGRTNDTNPELEFRFCSKCEGNYEYCNNHIFTHKHKSGGSVYY